MYIETSVCCDSYSELWCYSWSADCSASVSDVCGSGHNPDCLLRVVSVLIVYWLSYYNYVLGTVHLILIPSSFDDSSL